MTIRFRCRCGERLRADDDEAGDRIRCPECDKLVTVPDGDPPAEDDRPSSRRRRDEDEDEPRKRPRPKSAAKRRSGASSNLGPYLWIGGGVLLLALIVGLIVVFAFPSKSPAEQALVGEWESDPEQGIAGKLGFAFDTKLTFRADHSYRLSLIFEIDGRWKVVSRDGNILKVRLVHQVFGMDQDNPPTATITVIDKDHIEVNANEPSLQVHGRYRRVGTGPPAPPGPANGGPAKGPIPGGNPFQKGLDEGVQPDCEVQWGGTWFKAKIIKVENDRWFVHYLGWEKTWDEWVGKDRIRFPK